MRLVNMVAMVGLSACNSVLGIGEVHPGATIDAATADAAIDAGPSDVHGTAIDTYEGARTPPDTAPEDLSGNTLAAYVADGAGGFRIIAGVGSKDGTFTIPAVPAGPYTLYDLAPGDPTPHFYATSSHQLDLGFHLVGRASGPQVTKPTMVDFQMSGMTPAKAGDRFEIDSFAAGDSTGPINVPVAAGATTIDVGSDWQSMSFSPPFASLLQAGDDVWVLHYNGGTNAVFGVPAFVMTLADVYSAVDVTLTDGQPRTLTAAFTATPTAKQQQLDIQASAFLQGLDVTPDQPMSIVFRRRAALSAEAAVSTRGVLFITQTFTHPQQFFSEGWSYADPFPATWLRYTFENEALGWTYVTRGSGLPTVYTSSWTFQRRAAADSMTIAPVAAAPAGIRVGGVLAGAAAAIPFDGSHAVDVTWSPVAGITHYTVTAMRLDAVGGAPSLTPVATFDTAGTSVSMPAALLTLGGSYVISVVARQATNVDYPGGTLRRFGFPAMARENVTARLLFGASCGNGAVDAVYEECDASGKATATCNPDCTRSVCGDGIANAAAGEACDTGHDSLLCDVDCTPVTCGDGHVNAVAGEACDLGAQNGMAGKCCSATCQLVPPATTCP